MIKHSSAWHCGYGVCFFLLICILMLGGGVDAKQWNESHRKGIYHQACMVWVIRLDSLLHNSKLYTSNLS